MLHDGRIIGQNAVYSNLNDIKDLTELMDLGKEICRHNAESISFLSPSLCFHSSCRDMKPITVLSRVKTKMGNQVG